MIEPDADVATVRRGIQGFRDPKHPTKALDALDRLAARLQEAERERDEARGGFPTFNDFHVHLTRRAEATEAREKALREALEAIKHVGSFKRAYMLASAALAGDESGKA